MFVNGRFPWYGEKAWARLCKKVPIFLLISFEQIHQNTVHSTKKIELDPKYSCHQQFLFI